MRKGIVLDFRGSSNLVDAWLHEGVLTVRFKARDGSTGPSFRYLNMTPELMARWRDAPSAGSWFAREIRARHMQFPVIKDAAPAPAPASSSPISEPAPADDSEEKRVRYPGAVL